MAIINSTGSPARKHAQFESVTQFAFNVRAQRHQRGWSQEALALAAGVNRSFVGAIERCEHNPTLGTVEKLAQAFELNAADLLSLNHHWIGI